ncbi:MAG: peptidylprolyl isomerase [Syntrophobacteraceae bacterium]
MRALNKTALFFISMILSALFVCTAAVAEFIDRTVANVNGEIILYSEVQEQLALVEKYIPEANIQDPAKRAQVERDVLTNLIRQKLTEQEVKRLKVIVSNAEVDNTVDGILKENRITLTQFERSLKENGQSLQKFREGIKKELERNRLMDRALKSKVVITDAQVDAYLKSDGGSTAATEKFRLAVIFLPVDEKSAKSPDVEKAGKELLAKIKGGADFAAMARQHSKGPAAADGGDIGFMPPEELAPYIAEAVKGLRKGEVSGLVRGPGGFYLVQVSDIDRKVQSKSDPAFREKIRGDLFQKEVNRRFDEWVRNLESKAFIQISL